MSAVLPPIEALGRQLLAAQERHNEADLNPDEFARCAGMKIASDRIEALQNLVSTMEAVTLADVAVQIIVAFEWVSLLASSDCFSPEDLAVKTERLLLSAIPILSAEAGRPLAGAYGESLLALRASRFPAVSSAASKVLACRTAMRKAGSHRQLDAKGAMS